MKRIWIGIILLALLLGAGLWIADFMEQAHSSVSQDVRLAGKMARQEHWESARALAARGHETWQKKRPVTAAIADHEPMDEIDALFAQLEVYGEAEAAVAFRSLCAHLESQLEALAQSHRAAWWNLL